MPASAAAATDKPAANRANAADATLDSLIRSAAPKPDMAEYFDKGEKNLVARRRRDGPRSGLPRRFGISRPRKRPGEANASARDDISAAFFKRRKVAARLAVRGNLGAPAVRFGASRGLD